MQNLLRKYFIFHNYGFYVLKCTATSLYTYKIDSNSILISLRNVSEKKNTPENCIKILDVKKN